MLTKILFFTILIILLPVLLLLYSFIVSFRVPNWLKTEYNNKSPLFSNGKAQIAAHRAGAGLAPENTPLAFDICLSNKEFKIHEFEFDLHITRDEELILLHDESLNRTTNIQEFYPKVNVIPSNLNYNEIHQLNTGENFVNEYGEMPFKGLRGNDIPESIKIPKLEDIIDKIESNGEYLYSIDIKDKKEKGKKAADKLIKLCKEKGIIDKVIIASFNNEITAYLTKYHKDIQRSVGVLEGVVFYFCCALNIKFKKPLPFKAVQIFANQFRIIRCGTERFVRYCHFHNVAVQYWTIDDIEDIKYLNSIGADCIITNVPDRMYNEIYR